MKSSAYWDASLRVSVKTRIGPRPCFRPYATTYSDPRANGTASPRPRLLPESQRIDAALRPDFLVKGCAADGTFHKLTIEPAREVFGIFYRCRQRNKLFDMALLENGAKSFNISSSRCIAEYLKLIGNYEGVGRANLPGKK